MTSLCSIGGFALETRCHTGQVIRYDTVEKLGWSVDIRNHPIKVVLDRVFSEDGDWKPEFNEQIGEDDFGDEALFRFQRWGWWPGRKSDEEKEEKDGKRYREVPLPRAAVEVEGSEGICNVSLNSLIIHVDVLCSF
jgi:lipase ATG15